LLLLLVIVPCLFPCRKGPLHSAPGQVWCIASADPLALSPGFFELQPFISNAGYQANQGFWAKGGFFYLGVSHGVDLHGFVRVCT
jgi:hypothetical protein